MGCDIHLMAERLVEGQWVSADTWKSEEGSTFPKSIYRGRNYDLFAILADVRNGYGFAGHYTGNGFNPIAQPKGMPSDASQESKQYAEQWGLDGHSHSHFTLEQLLNYDWSQKTTYANGQSSTYAESCSDFLQNTIPALGKLGKPHEVRIVFFFDN